MYTLLNAPKDKQLQIVRFDGGHGVRRRLLSLGFHKDDIVEVDKKSLFGGPLLVKNITSDTSIGLGRGITKKIIVEVVE